MAGSTHLTSLISPVFIFLAIITGRSTGVDVRIVAAADVSSTTSNGLAVVTVVDEVDGGLLDSLPSVENMYRCNLCCCCGRNTLVVDDAVNAHDDDNDDTIIANRTSRYRCIIVIWRMLLSVNGWSSTVGWFAGRCRCSSNNAMQRPKDFQIGPHFFGLVQLQLCDDVKKVICDTMSHVLESF